MKPIQQLFAAIAITAAMLAPRMVHAQCTGAYPQPGEVALASNNAFWNPAIVPATPVYPNNFPPTNTGSPAGTNCQVCPSLFSANICANQYAVMYMCPTNLYTITLCNSGNAVNTSLSITSTNGATGFAFDDDGCGTANGLSTITFNPPIAQGYRIRVLQSPCTPNSLACGLTLEISCSPVPPPPPNDNICAATPLPVGTACNLQTATSAWATLQAGMPVPTCGSFGGYDVWFSAVVPASGNLSIQTALGSAANVAMALYTSSGGCAGTLSQWSCNNDVSPGNLQPFITASGLPPGQTVYIRVWPEASNANNGTFQICAYEPVPPPNDNPCGAAVVPLVPGCNPTTYSTESATPLQGNITTSPATPSCGTPLTGGDVWFSVVAPATGALTINTIAGTLTDMAMALYQLTSGNLCGPGTMTQLLCNDDQSGTNTMPRLVAGGLTPGATYYIRMWNKTSAFGTFQICAFETVPPSNDNPCGAIALTPQYGCLFSTFHTTENATQTPTLIGSGTIPNPTCGGVPNNDVWFTAVVPPNGVLQFDTDDAGMTNAAMAVYTATGTCGANNLSLTQVGCATAGSTNGPAMPYLSVGSLPPGATVYVRVWRETTTGPTGTFQICARRTDPPPGNCSYTLNMFDSAGDGWNGSTVQICVGAVCNTYSITGGSGSVTFGANFGQLVTVFYTSVGGFQNQISYTLTTPTGALLYGSGTTPATGLVYNFNVNTACNVPPAPPSDCIGAFEICNSQQFNGNPSNTGGVVDLGPSNRGCLSGNERQGLWFTWTVSTSGTLAFSIIPTSPTYTDYDFAVWGPFNSGITCPPPGAPMRCSFAAGGAATGTSFTSTDLTEGAGGDSWVRWLDVLEGQQYILYVDNWSMNGISFDFQWNANNTAAVDCVVLPLEFLSFEATAGDRAVDLKWVTLAEVNSAHFVVERSADAVDYAPIGRVDAMGHTTGITRYAFVDEAPLRGLNHYRLQQVDQDGGFTHSPVATAVFNGMPGRLTVFPNPATDQLFVQVYLPLEGTVTWRVLDATGRLAAQGRSSADGGSAPFAIPVQRLEAGSYLLELLDEGGSSLGNARFMRE